MSIHSQRQHFLQTARNIIANDGHMVRAVVDPIGATPPWAYTVGLASSLGIELLCFGLSSSIAASFLNQVAEILKSGRVIADIEPVHGVATVALRLISIPCPQKNPLGLVSALGYQPQRLRILQWPDEAGNFPGNPSYRHFVGQSLEDLSQPKSTH